MLEEENTNMESNITENNEAPLSENMTETASETVAEATNVTETSGAAEAVNTTETASAAEAVNTAETASAAYSSQTVNVQPQQGFCQTQSQPGIQQTINNAQTFNQQAANNAQTFNQQAANNAQAFNPQMANNAQPVNQQAQYNTQPMNQQMYYTAYPQQNQQAAYNPQMQNQQMYYNSYAQQNYSAQQNQQTYNVQQNPQTSFNTQQNQYSQANTYDNYSRYQQDATTQFMNGYTDYSKNQYGYTNTAETSKPKKEKSKAAKFFTGLGLAAAFGAVAAGMFIATLLVYNKINPEKNDEGVRPVSLTTADEALNDKLNLDYKTTNNDKIATTTVLDSVNTTATDVSEIVEKCTPCIVSISTTYNYSSFWGTYEVEDAGSGIIIEKNANELLIATNNHVIEDSKTISVSFSDDVSVPATIKGTDKLADLAVLSVQLSDIDAETLNSISIAKLGNSDDVKVGQMAIAIGNALGYGQSVTVGYISAKDREFTIDNQKMVLLQTDAAINPGNYGGALINLDGEVIGINTGKYTDSSVEGMGFAIPISRAQDILAELAAREVLKEEEKGYLGVKIANVTEDIASAYNWPVGVYIGSITEGSAADESDLQVSDIITAVNGVEVKTNDQLIEKISSMRQGTEVTLTVQRLNNGSFEELDIKVVLGENPEKKAAREAEKNAEGDTESEDNSEIEDNSNDEAVNDDAATDEN